MHARDHDICSDMPSYGHDWLFPGIIRRPNLFRNCYPYPDLRCIQLWVVICGCHFVSFVSLELLVLLIPSHLLRQGGLENKSLVLQTFGYPKCGELCRLWLSQVGVPEPWNKTLETLPNKACNMCASVYIPVCIWSAQKAWSAVGGGVLSDTTPSYLHSLKLT